MSDEPFESPKWFWPATGFGIGANAGQYDVTGGQVHIANIDFPAFYAEAAGGPSAAHSLYESLSNTGSQAKRTAKIMLHQAARMVWLADQVDRLARGRPALQIMFYMIAAEAVAKLGAGFEGEGNRGSTFGCSFRDTSPPQIESESTTQSSGRRRCLGRRRIPS